MPPGPYLRHRDRVIPGRPQRCDVDQVGQVRSTEAGRAARNDLQQRSSF
jgi:hypothetical protein